MNRNRLELRMRKYYLEDLTMNKNKEIAEQILEEIGGSDNVLDVAHCMTRLRLTLKDDTIVSDDSIKAISGVISIVRTGGQYQIVIGQNVSKVYTEFCKLGNIKKSESTNKKIDKKVKKLTKKEAMNHALNYISGSMVAMLPIILSAALLKSLVSIFGPDLLGWISADGEIASLLNMVYSAGFYFFPIYIGYTAAKKLNTSVPLAMFLGGVLVCPTFAEMAEKNAAFSVFGIPATAYNYSSTVLPMLLIVAVMAVVYKFIEKHIPTALNSTLTPTLTILIMLPISLCLLAPLGNILGTYLANLMIWIHETFGFIGVGIISALYLPMVITGMHSPICAIAFTQLFSTGSENLVFVGGLIASCALMAMDAALYLKIKDRNEKATILGALISMIASNVSEPSLYGVALPHRKSFLMMMIGAFVGGCYAGLFNAAIHSAIYVFPLSLLQLSGSDNTAFVNGVIGCLIAMGVTFVLTYLFGLTTKESQSEI